CCRRLLRPIVEKNMNHRIEIERMGPLVLERAELGHDKGCAGNFPYFVHRSSPRNRILADVYRAGSSRPEAHLAYSSPEAKGRSDATAAQTRPMARRP